MDGIPKSRSPSNIGSMRMVLPPVVNSHPFISRYVSATDFVDCNNVLSKCDENRGGDDDDDVLAPIVVDVDVTENAPTWENGPAKATRRRRSRSMSPTISNALMIAFRATQFYLLWMILC